MTSEISFRVVNDFASYFNSIILEALPFVVLGVVLAGILEEFVPQEWIRNFFNHPGEDSGESKRGILAAIRRLMRFRLAAIAVGGVLGLVFPMCECGIIAIMRRLIRKGVPLSVCVCYMLAGPIINVVVILSTFVAFNFPEKEEYVLGGPYSVTLLRAGLGFLIACGTAIIVEWQHRRHGDEALILPALVPQSTAEVDEENGESTPRPWTMRLGAIAETALHDFIDIMTFLVLGAFLASVGRMSLQNEQINAFTQQWIAGGIPIISIGMMMFIAVLFCLCSEADAFVAANFPPIWPPASKLSFLVLGPMFDLKLLAMYTRIYRRRLIITIVLAVVVQVLIYCLLVHYLWPYHGYPDRYARQLGLK